MRDIAFAIIALAALVCLFPARVTIEPIRPVGAPSCVHESWARIQGKTYDQDGRLVPIEPTGPPPIGICEQFTHETIRLHGGQDFANSLLLLTKPLPPGMAINPDGSVLSVWIGGEGDLERAIERYREYLREAR